MFINILCVYRMRPICRMNYYDCIILRTVLQLMTSDSIGSIWFEFGTSICGTIYLNYIKVNDVERLPDKKGYLFFL